MRRMEIETGRGWISDGMISQLACGRLKETDHVPLTLGWKCAGLGSRLISLGISLMELVGGASSSANV